MFIKKTGKKSTSQKIAKNYQKHKPENPYENENTKSIIG
jgi:hypothetical protein